MLGTAECLGSVGAGTAVCIVLCVEAILAVAKEKLEVVAMLEVAVLVAVIVVATALVIVVAAMPADSEDIRVTSTIDDWLETLAINAYTRMCILVELLGGDVSKHKPSKLVNQMQNIIQIAKWVM